MTDDRWLDEEEIYLRNLSGLCQELSGRYKNYYERYKVVQARFRIPSIVISSVTGLTSFGSSNFPPNYRMWVSISVGIASLSIAILNSIESYMKIGEHMAGSSQASVELHKLKEFIDMELAFPKENRVTQGIIFLRDCYTRYERILEIAPDILKVVRFISPSYNETIDIAKVDGSVYRTVTIQRPVGLLTDNSGGNAALSPVRIDRHQKPIDEGTERAERYES